jgi:hypothetical protein
MLIPNNQTTTKQLTDRLIELQHERDKLDKNKLGDKLRLMMVEGEMAGIHKVFQIKLRQK